MSESKKKLEAIANNPDNLPASTSTNSINVSEYLNSETFYKSAQEAMDNVETPIEKFLVGLQEAKKLRKKREAITDEATKALLSVTELKIYQQTLMAGSVLQVAKDTKEHIDSMLRSIRLRPLITSERLTKKKLKQDLLEGGPISPETKKHIKDHYDSQVDNYLLDACSKSNIPTSVTKMSLPDEAMDEYKKLATYSGVEGSYFIHLPELVGDTIKQLKTSLPEKDYAFIANLGKQLSEVVNSSDDSSDFEDKLREAGLQYHNTEGDNTIDGGIGLVIQSLKALREGNDDLSDELLRNSFTVATYAGKHYEAGKAISKGNDKLYKTKVKALKNSNAPKLLEDKE